MKDKICELESLAEKRRINEELLVRWISLKIQQVHLASYFQKRGIKKICLYGYGVLGRLVVKAMRNSSVEILCVIDRGIDQEMLDLPCYRSAVGLEEEYILVSVMSDVWMITNSLKDQRCKHIITLAHVLEVLEREQNDKEMGVLTVPYPELIKYRNIEGIKELHIANFGTGMGYYDFCYEDLSVEAFNFSLTQQTLEFDYKLMRRYKEKLACGCHIFLVLPYFIFLANHVLEIDEVNERYYAILPRTDVETRCNSAFYQFKKRYAYQRMLKSDVSEKFMPALDEIHEKSVQENQVEEVLNIWRKELGILSYESGKQRPEWYREITASKKWLEKIIFLCRERNWKPIIIIPPMSQLLLDRISAEFLKVNFYDILNEMKVSEIPILDYTENREFCNPDLYGAPCFLGRKGAKKFTKDVLNRIGLL